MAEDNNPPEMAEIFSVKWDRHGSNFANQLSNLQELCDATLAMEDGHLPCHKVVLAASSPFFQKVFKLQESPCQRPIVFLNDTKFDHVKALVQFMYYGKVDIPHDDLNEILKLASSLQITGLMDNETFSERSSSAPTQPDKRLRLIDQRKLFAEPPVSNGNGNGHSPSKNDGELIIDEEEAELMINEDGSHSGDVSWSSVDRESDFLYIHEPEVQLIDGSDHGQNGKGGSGSGKRKDWKRYKQYTKDDIDIAIEDVKKGMSALQASRKHGVPSRTLYDKVKKMGISTATMQRLEKQKLAAAAVQVEPLTSLEIRALALPHENLPIPKTPAFLPPITLLPARIQDEIKAKNNENAMKPQSSAILEKVTNMTQKHSIPKTAEDWLRLNPTGNAMANEAFKLIGNKLHHHASTSPLNLSSMLDAGIHDLDSGASGSRSGSGKSSGEPSEAEQRSYSESDENGGINLVQVDPRKCTILMEDGECYEDVKEEPTGPSQQVEEIRIDETHHMSDIKSQMDMDIRAQFFADLKRTSQNSILQKTQDGPGLEKAKGAQPITLTPREILPAKKRKVSQEVRIDTGSSEDGYLTSENEKIVDEINNENLPETQI